MLGPKAEEGDLPRGDLPRKLIRVRFFVGDARVS